VVLVLASSSGDEKSNDGWLLELLVFSQALLSFQLPFAIVPLLQLTSDRRKMGEFANGVVLQALAWVCAAVVIGLNGVLICFYLVEWSEKAKNAGWSPLWVQLTVGPLALTLATFLGWVSVYPYVKRRKALATVEALPPELPAVRYHRVGVAVEFTGMDEAVLRHAAALARTHQAPLVLIHVVEGLGASVFGPATDDQESRQDRERMSALVEHLGRQGLQAEGALGYGRPPEELVRLALEKDLDLLVVGTHGHRFLADLALGETVGPVLHRLPIPVLVVPGGRGSRQIQSADSRVGTAPRERTPVEEKD
jgi:manganese transport protein